MKKKRITFVVAVNKADVLKANFLASTCFQDACQHQIILQEGYASAARAYNDAIDKSVNEIIVFCHQDVFFPRPWMSQLDSALDYLEEYDRNWGVLGCSGITREKGYVGIVYSAGVGVIGTSSVPGEVQTLDEIVLILRKSSGIRFDDNLPHFHLYGADICLQAAKNSMKSYAISALCFHNTAQEYVLPEEFYQCCSYMRNKWKAALPIQTTCIRITKINAPVFWRRFRETVGKYVRRRTPKSTRVMDVAQAFEEISRTMEWHNGVPLSGL